MPFPHKQITFLGHEVSANGMKPGNLNLKGIAEMAPPATTRKYGIFLESPDFSGGHLELCHMRS